MYVGSDTVTVRNMKIVVFWDVTLCSVVDGYQHFVGMCYLHLIARRLTYIAMHCPNMAKWLREMVATKNERN